MKKIRILEIAKIIFAYLFLLSLAIISLLTLIDFFVKGAMYNG